MISKSCDLQEGLVGLTALSPIIPDSSVQRYGGVLQKVTGVQPAIATLDWDKHALSARAGRREHKAEYGQYDRRAHEVRAASYRHYNLPRQRIALSLSVG